MPTAPLIRRTIGPMHPGLVAAETLFELNLSKRDAAIRMGVKYRSLTSVVAGRAPITPELALRVSALIGLEPKSWLSMQADHDLWNAQQSIQAEMKKIKRLSARR